jgi:hypothetical protein
LGVTFGASQSKFAPHLNNYLLTTHGTDVRLWDLRVIIKVKKQKYKKNVFSARFPTRGPIHCPSISSALFGLASVIKKNYVNFEKFYCSSGIIVSRTVSSPLPMIAL